MSMRAHGLLWLLPILLSAPARAEVKGPLEAALARAGLVDAKVTRVEGSLAVTCRYADRTLDEPRLRKALVAGMQAITASEREVRAAAINVIFSDGHVMQVSGDPALFREGMSEAGLLRTARVRFLTRGPAVTPGPCARGMSCKKTPERCPCLPGSLCEPKDKSADPSGCVVVRATRNAEVVGQRSVCKPGHTWDEKGHDCVPIPECGAGLEHAGGCLCPPGVPVSSKGGCGADEQPASAPASAPTSAPTSLPTVEETVDMGGFPRWVWRAMAAGVGLSLPLLLYLLGSIFSGLRSRRSKIGLRKYCIQCGRKLAMDDVFCSRCKTQQP